MNLKAIIGKTETRAGFLFDLLVQITIIIAVITFSLETLPNLSLTEKQLLDAAEIFVILVFTLDYALRIYTAENKIAYLFSFYGLLDFIVVVPFYLSLDTDLRSLKMLRLLQFFWLFKMVRYHQAINRFNHALAIVKEEMILFGIVTVMLLYLSAVGIYYFENTAQPEIFKSIFHSLWWAIITLTTVGYGDMYPITVGGRIFTFLVLILGIGIVAVPAGLLASALSKVRLEETSNKNH